MLRRCGSPPTVVANICRFVLSRKGIRDNYQFSAIYNTWDSPNACWQRIQRNFVNLRNASFEKQILCLRSPTAHSPPLAKSCKNHKHIIWGLLIVFNAPHHCHRRTGPPVLWHSDGSLSQSSSPCVGTKTNAKPTKEMHSFQNKAPAAGYTKPISA